MDEHVDFTAMKDGTKEEYELLARLEKPYLALTSGRVIEELRRAGEATLCLLYTSPSPRDRTRSRMPSSA